MDVLWSAINQANWVRVEGLLNSSDIFGLHEYREGTNRHPESFNDGNGDILSALCMRNAPLNIIRSTHFIYGQLAMEADYRSLLRWAYNGGGSDHVYGFLLDVAPHTKVNDREAPIHKAILKKRNPFIIKKILMLYPNAVNSRYPDEYGETPCEIFFRLWEDRLEEIRERNKGNFANVLSYHKDYKILLKVKEILILLLKASLSRERNMHYRKFRKQKSWLPLHEAIRYKETPCIFVVLLVELIPDENKKIDASGNYPLHLAVSHNGWHSEYLTECILRQYPRAARMTNKDSKLPLALFIESGKGKNTNNIKNLVHAAPDSISKVDTSTLLYPFMLALCSDRAPISVANELLKMDPSLVQGGVPVSEE